MVSPGEMNRGALSIRPKKPVISGENQMELKVFGKKISEIVDNLSRWSSFPKIPKRPKFPVPFTVLDWNVGFVSRP